MSKSLPARCDVVIIGGGIVGASIAYHLSKIGITNTVVLERKQLTSGTTWHAAGLVGQLRASKNLTELAKYTTNLFEGLEKETGQHGSAERPISIASRLALEELFGALPCQELDWLSCDQQGDQGTVPITTWWRQGGRVPAPGRASIL